MTRDEIQKTILRHLREVAPETESESLDPKADLREELDLDSMDFLNVVEGLHGELGVDIPESDYPKIGTLDDMTRYLAHKVGVN